MPQHLSRRGSRKFSLFGLFPQTGDCRLSQQYNTHHDPNNESESGEVTSTSTTPDCEKCVTDDEESMLTRTSSWTRFIKSPNGQTESQIEITSPGIFGDNFADVNIPTAYSGDNENNDNSLQLKDKNSIQSKSTFLESMHSLYTQHKPSTENGLRAAVSMEQLPRSENTPQTEDTAVVSRNRSFSMPRRKSSGFMGLRLDEMDRDKSSTLDKEQCAFPLMPVPPPKPKKVKVRKHELNMFAPTTM